MLNSQGSTIIAPDQTLTTQTSPAIQFSQYADVLKSFAQVDDTSASALISQLQTMQGALSDETVIADIAMANNLDPKQLQLAVRMISAKDAATHLSSTSVDAQGNVIASPSNIP